MTETIKELMPYLQKIADKLESSANALWQLQMAQAKVALITGIAQYIALLIFVVMWLAVCKYLHSLCCKYEEQRKNRELTSEQIEDKTFGFVGVPFITMIFAIGYYVFRVPSITEMFTLMYNPEYWALHELLRMVK